MRRPNIREALRLWIDSLGYRPRHVLLLPPDFTRGNSGAGIIVQELYALLGSFAQMDIMPALGTHVPMSHDEIVAMFGLDFPRDCFIDHDWRHDVVKIGEVSGDFVRKISKGLVDYSIDVEVNRRLLDQKYDLIVSIGQVVPHEVVGMANYTKNVVVGCGGKSMIDKSHFLGAVYGMERLMGRDHSPVRQVFDYAEERFLHKLPLQYILTVTTTQGSDTIIEGLYLGRSRTLFEEAVALSQEKNLDRLDEPLQKVVVYLDPDHFKSTWIGNKAIYRLRMAMADEGELLIMAPGVKQFGEDPMMDQLIRKYGYRGTTHILEMVENHVDLQENLSAAAHLIHGSSEGRFRIVYAPGLLTRDEIEGVGFEYMSIDEAMAMYDRSKMRDGMNLVNGEEVFFVSNPALGLWVLEQ